MTQPPASPPSRDQIPLDVRMTRAREGIERGALRALVELQIPEDERLSDELRAATHAHMTTLLMAIAADLAGALDWAVDIKSAVDRLNAAEWLNGTRLRPALSHARHRLLRERLLSSSRAFGISDPVRDLLSRKEPLSSAAGHLFRSEEHANEVDALPPLPLEEWQESVWAVAAAMRLERAQAGAATSLDDQSLHAAVTDHLRALDDDRGTKAAATRLARLMPAAVSTTEALPGGHTELFLSLLAARTEVPEDVLEEWLFAAEPLPIAAALRASGEQMPNLGASLIALAEAKGQSAGATADVIMMLHTLSQGDARRLVKGVR